MNKNNTFETNKKNFLVALKKVNSLGHINLAVIQNNKLIRIINQIAIGSIENALLDSESKLEIKIDLEGSISYDNELKKLNSFTLSHSRLSWLTDTIELLGKENVSLEVCKAYKPSDPEEYDMRGSILNSFDDVEFINELRRLITLQYKREILTLVSF